MHSNLDDVLEHYATPSAEYSSWSAQNHCSGSSSRKKAELRSRMPSTSKKSSVSPLLATGSRSSVSHTHSFLGKYGVGTYFTPGSSSHQGDTSSTYWLKRLGMIETASSEKRCVRPSKTAGGPKRSSSPSPAAAHRRSSSSRRMASGTNGDAIGEGAETPRGSMRMVEMGAGEKSPGRAASAASVQGARGAFVQDTVDRAVAKLQADAAEGQGVLGDTLDSELMRQVLLGQPSRGDVRAAVSENGSCGVSGTCTPASAVSHPAISQAESCSENGDSWSVASATSSFSILSSLNIDSEDRARGGAQGFGYATVLLMSDEEDAGAPR